MKRLYNAPSIEVLKLQTEGFLAASRFDETKGTQEITPTNDPYGGKFKSPRHGGWDDDEDEDDDF